MKKRVFSEMDDAVFRIVIDTEDWSQGDLELMEQFGEPEVNVGGSVDYVFGDEVKTKEFGNEFVRVLHGFPYSRGFDSRDYGDYESSGSSGSSESSDPYSSFDRRVSEAVAVGNAWKETVLRRLDNAVLDLRANHTPLPTEEVSEI